MNKKTPRDTNFNSNYLGHEFKNINHEDFFNDYACLHCNIRINYDVSNPDYQYHIADDDEVNELYKLTCDEQLIKNIIE